MSSSSSRYTYEPLNPAWSEIRLLTITDGGRREPISVSLETVSLDDRPEYIALSYVWGDASDTVPIKLHGTSFNITRNLHDALMHRPFDHLAIQNIWIDSICVNQQDTKEKNTQVPLMGRVYSNATQVCCWLGSGNRVKELAFDVLSQMALAAQPESGRYGRSDTAELDLKLFVNPDVQRTYSNLEPQLDLKWLVDPAVERAFSNLKPFLMPNFDANRAVAALFSVEPVVGTSYWQRAWTFQEFVLASYGYLVYGRQTLPISRAYHLDKTFEALAGIDLIKPPGIRADVWAFISSPNIGVQLLQLSDCRAVCENLSKRLVRDNNLVLMLEASKKRKSSDPRDKIYSLLGVAKVDFQVDYDQPVEGVFNRAAELVVGTTRHGLFLQGLEHGNRCDSLGEVFVHAGRCLQTGKFPGLASWCPEWDTIEPTVPYGRLQKKKYRGLEARIREMDTMDDLYYPSSKCYLGIGGLRCKPVVSSGSLQCKGVVIAQVSSAHAPTGHLKDSLAFIFNSRGGDVSEIDFLDALRITIQDKIENWFQYTHHGLEDWRFKALASHFESLLRIPTRKTTTDAFTARQSCDGTGIDSFTPLSAEQNRVVSEFMCEYAATFARAICFRTTTGHIGRVSFTEASAKRRYMVRPGDLVVITGGCDCPIILRQIRDHYELMGPAFIPRLMYGEASELVEKYRIEVQDLSIH